MTRKQKRNLLRIVAATLLFVGGLIVGYIGLRVLALICYLTAYLTVGYDVLIEAFSGLIRLQFWDENFLMTIASIGAIALGEYRESVFVMLFYQVGELFQSCAVGKSRRSISSLMDIRPDSARVLRSGKMLTVSPEEVAVGETIEINPGEKIPLDGIIVEGESNVNTVALTGESLPRGAKQGDDVISGCINMSGVIRVRVTKAFGDSTVSKILDLVENSAANKAKSVDFITKFARYYTPTVMVAALLLGTVVPIFAGNFVEWINRALIFLVISCPCALVISVPLSYFGGIGAASSKGVLIKGSNYLEAISAPDIVVFDKTGTLTVGDFSVTAVHSDCCERDELLLLAAAAEAHSNHPIAVSLRKAAAECGSLPEAGQIEEIAGQGIRAAVGEKIVLVGNSRLMQENGIVYKPCQHTGTVIHVAAGQSYLGHIVISDRIKDGSAMALRLLKEIGVRKTVMLTGDRRETGEAVAKELGIDETYTELLPADKVSVLEKLLDSKRGTVVFVGDGINDAPVLSRCDIGVAMGAMGSDAAIEAADVVLMDDNPVKIVTAIRIARKTSRLVKENIFFALGVKIVFLALGALGIAGMFGAVFADVGVSVLAVLNAMRALHAK